jgi:DNA mismatch repair ATPase MutS
MKNIPDLLNHKSQVAPNMAAAHKVLKFAFLTGDSGGDIKQLLGRTPIAESGWAPDCYFEDLFLDDFIDNCLLAPRDGDEVSYSRPFLKRVLCHPPTSSKTTCFRQNIQQEMLQNKKFREQFWKAYSKLVQLRDNLDTVSDMGRLYFTRWRLGVLEEIKETVDVLAKSFEDAKSGISRIREYALEFQRSDAYKNLAEFLRYEDGMAVVNVELRLSSDGKVRGFGITQAKENQKNRFHAGPVKRFFSRVGLLLRGYRFTGEEMVERWVDGLFEILIPYLGPMLQLIGDMEFHLASSRFRSLCSSRDLETCYPVFIEEDDSSGRSIEGLFNPLLIDQDLELVECDVSCESSDVMVILTGPNSGGKTRLLQSLGLLQLLGQTGFIVPARKARMRWATGLFASLQAGFTSDQQEGRLGTELVRIRRVFEKAQPGSMVILDELCSGTNPCEGEEIFLLVLSLLTRLKPEAFITTHFLRFAKDLDTSAPALDLEFLQVELDVQQRPTYRFVPGVAQTSLAKHTAARLGVTRQHLMDLIDTNETETRVEQDSQRKIIDIPG